MSIKSEIQNAYNELTEAQSDFTKIANQRLGCITGAPSIDAERERLEAAQNVMEKAIHGAMWGSRAKRRYNYVRRLVYNVFGGEIPRFVADIMDDSEINPFL